MIGAQNRVFFFCSKLFFVFLANKTLPKMATVFSTYHIITWFQTKKIKLGANPRKDAMLLGGRYLIRHRTYDFIQSPEPTPSVSRCYKEWHQFGKRIRNRRGKKVLQKSLVTSNRWIVGLWGVFFMIHICSSWD